MSTVIKRGQEGELLHRPVTFDMTDHLAEARLIVTSAQSEARWLLGQAKQECRRLREKTLREARQEGFKTGYAEGAVAGRDEALAEAKEQFDQQHAYLADSMAAVIEALDRDKQDLLIEAGRDLLEFAVALAAKVTHSVARTNPQAAVANVEQALRLVGNKTDLTVRVHPSDAETLRNFAAEAAERVTNSQHLTVQEDESIAPGGAVVNTDWPTAGQIDARIETQLEQITTLLLGREGK